jgi:hypothetical protein
MDKHLWLSLLRLVDEGSAEQLQAKKEGSFRAWSDFASLAARFAAMYCASCA